MRVLGLYLGLLMTVVISITALPAGALASCGDIIFEQDYGDGPTEEREAIEDCANPFNVDSPAPFEFELSIADQEVSDDSVVFVEEGMTSSLSFSINKPGNFTSWPVQLFRQEETDYRNIYNIEEDDQEIGPLDEGKYVAILVYEQAPIPVDAGSTWKRILKDIFLPQTALAFFPDNIEVVSVSFSVEYKKAEPAGASSVLFLPGILGSRLFEEGEFCEALSSESQLWFSINECKQQRLTTSFIGQSERQVYTKTGVAGILDEAISFNIYKTFLNTLADWKDEEIINDYAVVPYDWRDELDEVLKSKVRNDEDKIFSGQAETVAEGILYNATEDLAEDSLSGKVTVVAHSNGGLVIKQFIRGLQNTNDPLLSKIDNVILVAVPQLGAPNAAIAILHGEELDPVMSQVTSRHLMNTMPFSHHLLPTTAYFDSVDTPVIRFEPGEATDQYINDFGNTIVSRNALHHFLSTDSGRSKPTPDDLKTPEVVDSFLLNYAKTTEVVQNNFTLDSGMKVYQIAGTGLETPSTLTYFSDKECVARTLFICTEYRPKMSYRVDMTLDGDETVPVPSALALSSGPNIERRWLNLFEYNRSNINRKHNNILEVYDVINFVLGTIQADADKSYDYLTENAPSLVKGERLIFQLHSPLDMSAVNEDGKEISSSTREIDTAVYRRYGELQYISVPRSERITLRLNGLATGSFTLDIEEVKDGKSKGKHIYSAIPSSTSTKVLLEISNDSVIENLPVAVDYDGDGVSDVNYDQEGVVVDKETYDNLFQKIDDLKLKKAPKKLILNTAKSAEKFHKKAEKNGKYTIHERVSLKLLLHQVLLYERLHLISDLQRTELKNIITRLLNSE